MRVLFAGFKHDYADPARGLAFEFHNFVRPLQEMADEVILVDTGIAQRGRRRELNRRLPALVQETRPDAIVTMLFEDELALRTLDRMRATGTPMVNWFADDHWRFDSFSRKVAPHVGLSVTTSTAAQAKYEKLGLPVQKSQWACDPFRYRPVSVPLGHDVSFVGQPHGDRRQTVQALADAGIKVDAFGHGWPNGRVSQEEMVRIFSASRINLNLSNSSVVRSQPRWLRRLANRVARLPMPTAVRTAGRKAMARPWVPTTATASTLSQQIKGRNFEIPACGGFTLTEEVEDLASYYEVGSEVVCYRGQTDLLAKVRYYLSHEDERAAIARAGLLRTLADHTWFHRFEHMFHALDVPSPSAAEILARGSSPGRLMEVFP